jgi:hypothetical protein
MALSYQSLTSDHLHEKRTAAFGRKGKAYLVLFGFAAKE